MSDRDYRAELEAQYAEAVERRAEIAAEWERLKRPLTSTGSAGQPIEHVLLKMIRDLDIVIVRLATAVSGKRPGRDPVAVLSSSIGKSPAAKLREKG